MRLPLLTLTVATTMAAQTPAQPRPKPSHAAAHAVAGPSALDKKQLEFYVRHLFVWPDQIKVTVGNPAPSQVPGFLSVVVHASEGQASEDQPFLVSKDGKQIIRGSVYKVTENPFRDALAKIKTADRPSLGTPGAPVVLVEFSDFQCHFCKEEAKHLRDNLIQQYPKEVHFFFVDNPIEALHPWARAAAIAGRCVYHQNEPAFWDFHDWIFEHQTDITTDNLNDKVSEWTQSAKGVDAAKLSSCIATKAPDAEIDAGIALAHSLAVNSTPTTFVNGRPLVGAVPWEDVKRVIDFEIGYQNTAHDAGENCGCDLGIRKLGVN